MYFQFRNLVFPLQSQNEYIANLKDQLQEMKAKSNLENRYMKTNTELQIAQTQRKCNRTEELLLEEIEVIPGTLVKNPGDGIWAVTPDPVSANKGGRWRFPSISLGNSPSTWGWKWKPKWGYTCSQVEIPAGCSLLLLPHNDFENWLYFLSSVISSYFIKPIAISLIIGRGQNKILSYGKILLLFVLSNQYLSLLQ